MPCTQTPASLLTGNLKLFDTLPPGPILDLACGRGRNALWLARKGLPLWCCDRNADALAELQQAAADERLNLVTWHRDLEIPGDAPLAGRRFAAILVFNYLHRPLMSAIEQALMPGGLLIYETFLEQQADIGKPSNRDFLLKPGELQQHFASLQTLHYVEEEHSQPHRFTAQLIARKG
ncbi:methyltransferase domain-containing protein [Ferrimonas sediminicola]|uniref:Methyltransferase domain-containing protein n=1 Tax=Ferrimonas sediminicola TaxID=2569538 RepID=A0A4U1BE28_9GAMM|nr:methyltransferase domain-containing protein [Ferrimonas sediminicola]TKB49419.1 methyltransferase domain-containing protein [Ferrimonas sediminicola]